MSPRPLNRRRFLSICAAAGVAGPTLAREWTRETWQGRALGAEARITLAGPPETVRAALDGAVDALRQTERYFSLFDPGSVLSRLNATGALAAPAPEIVALLRLCGEAHLSTGGLFDPTVQPLWQTLARGGAEGDLARARAAIGWHRVQISSDAIRLGPGQALTLNGIAQGAAADAVVSVLRGHGIAEALVDSGEVVGRGGDWRLGIADPEHGTFATRRLRDGAIATSSPGALSLGREAHILSPVAGARPVWSSVSVEAAGAAWADALSTAAVMMDAAALADLADRAPGLRRIVAIDGAGDVTTFLPAG